ncbi:MAG: VCBS repeat-containing protein [Planctomycetaceae bacterium]|nr:VCBS repeat-containing protein [Planctomycetaceae bacterium]
MIAAKTLTIGLLVGLAWFESTAVAQVKPPVNFEPETIDSQVIIGYGTAIGDVDGDGRQDILLADKKQFVWYRNPDWKRFVLAENLTEKDNVCIAARDIDGDGKVEIAVGGQWSPGDTEKSGAVFYLKPGPDRKAHWTPIRLPHEPVVHRMRWLKLPNNKFGLVVAPLHGRGNKKGKGAGVRLLVYQMVNGPEQPWEITEIDSEYHVTHNFDIAKTADEIDAEDIFYLGREGAKQISYRDGQWQRKKLTSVQGGGEIRFGKDDSGASFLATIEPFHGTDLVLYKAKKTAKDKQPSYAQRTVLDSKLNQGHAVAVGDFLGNGERQIVAGWRAPNESGKFGIKFYFSESGVGLGGAWSSFFVDENEMACEDLRAADLDGDGRLDIVASGRSTHNLKIYWNRPSK